MGWAGTVLACTQVVVCGFATAGCVGLWLCSLHCREPSSVHATLSATCCWHPADITLSSRRDLAVEGTRCLPGFQLASQQHPAGFRLQTMKERGWMRYTSVEEGELTAERVAVVPEDIDRRRVRFQQGDACNLPPQLGQVDAGRCAAGGALPLALAVKGCHKWPTMHSLAC